MPSINSEVAIGRRMKGSDMLTAGYPGMLSTGRARDRTGSSGRSRLDFHPGAVGQPVLAVDDDPRIRRFVSQTLKGAGHVVVTDGASVLHGDSVTNSGTMTVEAGASLTLEGNTTLINEAGGLIKADGGTVAIELDTDSNVNSGTIQAVNGGEVDFYINRPGRLEPRLDRSRRRRHGAFL